MGRLIDVADLNVALGMEVLCGNKTVIQVIQEAPTVEAIPKADYENRLKADMAAMLTEVQLEIEEKYWRDTQGYIIRRNGFNSGIEICVDIIQEKINALKGVKDGNK